MFAQKNLHVNTNSRHEPEAFQLHGAKRASKDSELRTSQYIYVYSFLYYCTLYILFLVYILILIIPVPQVFLHVGRGTAGPSTSAMMFPADVGNH